MLQTDRFSINAAVMAIIIRNKKSTPEVLLQLRKNTGYMDDHWDLAATGHVEYGESLTEAVCREAKEEIGIDVESQNVEFAHLAYLHVSETMTYANVYFIVNDYTGSPRICEHEKCSALSWFPIDHLPDAIIADRRVILRHIAAGISYSEKGFYERP